MNGWCPKPWKGMVWHRQVGNERVWTGPIYEDLIWSGTNWEPNVTSSPDKPLVMAGPSQVSVKLAEHFRLAIKHERACTVTAKELNRAYQDFDLDRTGQEENFLVTVSAFVRSWQRLAQCRKLIMNQPEIWIGVDDIFMEFIVKVRESIEGYKHDDKLDRWIAVVWKNFIKDRKKEVRLYLHNTFFVNNRNVGDSDFKFQKHCVNTKKISADLPDTESELAVARLLSELDDPSTPLGQLKDLTKIMLRHMAAGRNQTDCAVDLGVSEKTIRRWMAEAQKASRKMLSKVDDCEDQSTLLKWPEQGEQGGDLWGCDDSFPNSFSIQASEDFTFEPLLGVPEAAKLLGIHPKTLQAMARAGSVPCVRFGKYWRFRASVLDAWVRDRLTSDHQSRRVS
jgi:excisionase family DNA binding protein